MRPIDADALYEKAASLEAQALNYIEKLMERDGHEVSTEFRIWSAILAERTAFKHDVFDAPTIKRGRWIDETFKPWGLVHHPYKCDQCGEHSEEDSNFCPNCGARMEGTDETD